MLFCLVPSPEFSQAPWDSHPAHLCWFRVRVFYNLKLRGFSWKHGINHFVSNKLDSSSRLRIRLPDLPKDHSAYTLKPGQPTPADLAFSVTPSQLQGTGILTCFPSTTPFGLALGPTHPTPISVAWETLGFRRAGFSPALSLLMSAFALPIPPATLTGYLQRLTERSSTMQYKHCIRSFGT